MKSVALLCLALLIVACANRHHFMNGTVALKINETKGVACLDTKAMKRVTELSFMAHDCSKPNPLSDISSDCPLIKKGKTSVTKILNDHYVEFETIYGWHSMWDL